MTLPAPPNPKRSAVEVSADDNSPDEYGSFSDDGPWRVHRDDRNWRGIVPLIRNTTRASVPALLSRQGLPPLRRLLTTVGHLGVALGGWVLFERRRGGDASTRGLSVRLRIAAERLGPTYVKLGQIISSGEGIFPEPLVTEFIKCRDQVPAQPTDVVRAIVRSELGCEIHEVFDRFDDEPIAAASIAQVHRATLATGENVVVKVQRLGIDRLVRDDLAVMAWMAPFLIGRIPVAALANPPALVETFAQTITEELDFRLEAANMLDVAAMFSDLDQDGFVVPRPHDELVTRAMLVMEELAGFSFDDIEGMRNAGIDTKAVLKTGMVGFLEGALIHGVFHGDLHGGNLFVQPDGKVALLDYGITGRLNKSEQTAFLQLMVSGTMSDPAGQVKALCALGALPLDTDIEAVVTDLGLDRPVVDPTTLSTDALVEELGSILRALLGCGARLPKPLMLFAKNLVFLDGAIARLAPDLDLIDEVARIATFFAQRHGEEIANRLGIAAESWEMDMGSVKASMGLTDDVDSISYAELQERRDLIRKRLGGKLHPGRV